LDSVQRRLHGDLEKESARVPRKYGIIQGREHSLRGPWVKSEEERVDEQCAGASRGVRIQSFSLESRVELGN
jgi:hypothetical protein